MERILKIEDIYDYRFPRPNTQYYGEIDGLKITTTDQTILIGISSGQSCCEDSGYVTSEDDYKNFVDAELLSISLTDTSLENVEVPNLYDGDAMFVNLETSVGLFQVVAYNSHNGYYGHNAVVVSKQLNYSEVL